MVNVKTKGESHMVNTKTKDKNSIVCGKALYRTSLFHTSWNLVPKVDKIIDKRDCQGTI